MPQSLPVDLPLVRTVRYSPCAAVSTAVGVDVPTAEEEDDKLAPVATICLADRAASSATFSASTPLPADTPTYRLTGTGAPGAPADAAGRAQTDEGLVFTLRDKENPGQTVEVVYHGSVPDQFKSGREIVVTGALDAQGRFIAREDSLVTLCPSKFSDEPGDTST